MCYLNKPQNARCNDKDSFLLFFEGRKSRLMNCDILPQYALEWPIPLAGRFLGIAVSNPARSMEVCLL